MLRPSAALAVLTGVCAMCAAQPSPVLVETLFPTEDHVIASAIVAPPTGEVDAAPVLQAAIDQLASLGGGVVFAHAGRYRLESTVTVKEGVTLRGDWAPPTEGRVGEGTLLAVYAGKGATDGPPAVVLERGSGIREVALWYPEQSAEQPVPYPWAIKTSTQVGGDNYTVENVTLVNPWLGIGVGPEWNELHTVRKVWGTPLSLGVFVDTTTDIGRLSRVDFSPRWWVESGLPGAPTDASAVERGLRERGAVAYELGRSDWEYLYDVRAEGYATGIRIRPGAQGTTNAQIFLARLTRCGIGLDLEALNGVGLIATAVTTDDCDVAILGRDALRNTCVQIQSCDLGARQECLRNSGNSVMSLYNTRLSTSGENAIALERGMLSLAACELPGGASRIVLGSEVRQARILTTDIEPDRVVTQCDPRVLMLSRTYPPCEKPDVSPHPFAPTPVPERRALADIRDFGATTASEDNTGAIQAALDSLEGGGTVYIPAGNWAVRGSLRVPSGVELRGCFDVPHHTVSAGSVLLAYGGRGEVEGTPLVELSEGSGVRGLTVWYPEQDWREVVAYPWAVRSLGPRCWVVDTTIGNGYQGVDFASHPSDGHVVRYLSGGFLRCGLRVSKSAGEGWLEDVMYNPHYMARLNARLPQGTFANVDFEQLIRYIRGNLTGIALGSLADEHVCGTFLYAANEGMLLYDDDGGPNVRVIGHGTDTGSYGVCVRATGSRGAEFVNAQLVPLSHVEKGAVVTTPEFAGNVRFFSTQVWAGTCTGLLEGTGSVLIQQMNTLSGPIRQSGGEATLEGAYFQNDLAAHIEVGAEVRAATLTGNLSRGAFQIGAADATRLLARANALPAPRRLDPGARYHFASSWAAGDPQGIADTIASPGGGSGGVSDAGCAPVPDRGRDGSPALRLHATSEAEYSYCYFRVFDTPVRIASGTVLRYWVRPETALGRQVGVDLVFTDGATLRAQGVGTTKGRGTHPSAGDAPLGEWTEVVIPLGALEGRTIRDIMFAYDSRSGAGPVEALFDDLTIDPGADAGGEEVIPYVDTRTAGQALITLECRGAARVRYSLDGRSPDGGSPVYAGPFVVTGSGLHEVRFQAENADGTPAGPLGAVLCELP